MEKQEKNCRPDNLYYCGIVLPLAGILFLALLRLLKIPLNHILLPCIFHKLTGLYCPGCGGTRAVVFLLHGDFLHSLVYHPFVPYAFVLCTWFMISQTIERLSKGRLRIGMHFREVFLWIALAIIIINFIVKNAALLFCQIDFMPLTHIS